MTIIIQEEDMPIKIDALIDAIQSINPNIKNIEINAPEL